MPLVPQEQSNRSISIPNSTYKPSEHVFFAVEAVVFADSGCGRSYDLLVGKEAATKFILEESFSPWTYDGRCAFVQELTIPECEYY